jgi:Tol biopolymer transport system component
MDLWMISADGTGLRQLTNLSEDDPVSVWSPDGRWVAFTGALGLYLLDVTRGTVIRIHDEGGGGGLTWLTR